MNGVALAGLTFLGMAATAMSIFGITYLCTHKAKPSKSTSESSATDLDKLNLKNSQGKGVKNKKNDNSMNPTIKSLNPSDVLEKSALKTKYGEKIYKKGNKKIRLHRQEGLTCGICAAAFAICASGKTNETDIEKVVNNAIKVKHINTHEELELYDIIGIFNMYNMDSALTNVMTPLKNKNEIYIEKFLKDCINSDSIVIINLAGHWVTVCGCTVNAFDVYDSSLGYVTKMTAKDIFNRLPVPTMEEVYGTRQDRYNKDYNDIWRGNKALNAIKVKC